MSRFKEVKEIYEEITDVVADEDILNVVENEAAIDEELENEEISI